VIQARNPYQLTQDMEPEFGMMLSYLQELNSKKKPNYKMLRSQFEVMKERHNCKLGLEWNLNISQSRSNPKYDKDVGS
jgi:hypothetical protein